MHAVGSAVTTHRDWPLTNFQADGALQRVIIQQVGLVILDGRLLLVLCIIAACISVSGNAVSRQHAAMRTCICEHAAQQKHF